MRPAEGEAKGLESRPPTLGRALGVDVGKDKK